jgi:hypothetical protein
MDEVKRRKQRMTWISKMWRTIWPLVALALLCAAFFWDVFWLPQDRIVAGNDLTDMFFLWLRFADNSIEQGQLPLWNPYVFSGLPFVANPQPALFYPPTWLVFLMPISKALGLIIVLHVWLAGVGMYAWLRTEGASTKGALLGGTVFAFSGYFFARVQAGHLGVVTTGTWLPFLLWAYRRAVTRRSWSLAVMGGLPVGLSILTGHTASFVYVALGLVAYAAFCAWDCWREERSARAVVFPLVWLGVMLLVGLVLAAVQLLPMVELVVRSTRQATSSYNFATRFSWPPGYLLTLLIPNFFGEPTHTGYWGEGIYEEFIFYIGVLPLLLALLGLRLRHRLKPFLAALGLGALLLALGEYGSLHLIFYRFVPLFQMGRAPARAGFLFMLAAATLTGLTTTALQSTARDERERLLRPLGRWLVLAVAAGALVVIVAGFAAFAVGREASPGTARLWHTANQTALFLILFLLAYALLAAWRCVTSVRAGLWLLALGLVVLDLWTFDNRVVEPVDVGRNEVWRAVKKAVDDHVGDRQAVRVLPWGLNDFEQNGCMRYELRSVLGYDPLYLQRYDEFISSVPDPRARTYDLLNVGYLVTTTPQNLSEPGRPRLVLERDGVRVYERPNALPRAWVTQQVEVIDDAGVLARIHDPDFDPHMTALVESPVVCGDMDREEASEVEIVHYEGNRIEAQVRGGGGLLIFSEVDYPGWYAAVDGFPARLIRTDYLLRALCVPAGEHQVVLTYDPPLLKIGLAITVLTLLSVIGVAAWRLFGGLRRQR